MNYQFGCEIKLKRESFKRDKKERKKERKKETLNDAKWEIVFNTKIF